LTAASQPLTFHLRDVTGLPHILNIAAAVQTKAGPDFGQCSRSRSDSHQEGAMSGQLRNVGFAYSRQRRQRRSVMFAQLIATVTLIVSIAVVVTAVSIGIAHAGALGVL
jgi:hypothetical protein